MFALVVFTDIIFYICKPCHISASKKNGPASVKYTDKKKYAARILALHENYAVLKNIKTNLEGNGKDVNLGSLKYTQQELLYAEILQSNAKHQDYAKVYFDPSIVPSQSDLNSKNFVFSLRVDDHPGFFDTQSAFVEAIITVMHDVRISELYDSQNDVSAYDASTGDANTTNMTIPGQNSMDAIKIPKEISVDVHDTSTTNVLSFLDDTEFKNILINETGKSEQCSFGQTFTIVNTDHENFDTENSLVEKRLSAINVDLQNSPQKFRGKPTIIHDEVLAEPILQVYRGSPSAELRTSAAPDLETTQVDDIPSRSTSLGVLDTMLAGNIFYREVNVSDDVHLPDRSLTPPPVTSTVLECATGTYSLDIETETKRTETADDQSDGESDEYVPSPAESSEYTDSESEGIQEPENDKKKPPERTEHDESRTHASFNATLGLNRFGLSAPDDSVLTVHTSETVKSYMKKHFCMYCHKFQTKIARHLELVHGKEDDVKKFAALPPKNRERQQIIATIRKNGDHLYNTDRRFNTGMLVVCRNPNRRMSKTPKDFLPCPKCKGQYTRTVYRHHVRNCVKVDGKKERIFMVKGRKIAAKVHEKASEAVRTNIFPYMREDNVVRSIRYDELLVIFANRQCEKYSTHQHQYQMIRGRLRLLGRFLIEIKELNRGIKDFIDVFQPRNYDDTILAVKRVAKYDPEKRTFANPTNASTLGTLLKAMGEMLRSEFIKREDEHQQKRVEDFLKLQAEDFGISVNRAVAETQAQNNRRKKVDLPSIDDITKLHSFLKGEREKYFNELQSKFSFNSWKKLAEVTLVSLQLFNRRRPGEMERLYLEDFNSYQGIDKDVNKESYEALSKEAKVLARKYIRFEIRGKLGRSVPVLVNSDLFDSLLLLIRHRDEAEVPEYNRYLFGLPSKDKDRCRYLRACDLLREYSGRCGAVLPNRLRGTKLRKHIATQCIRLNLSENQVTDLANYMGHDEKIHKTIYRQPILETDIVKMSKLLEFVQGQEESSDEEESENEESAQNKNPSKKRKFDFGEQNESIDGPEDTEKPGTSASQCKIRPEKRTTELSSHAERATHRRWTDKERGTVLGAFKDMLVKGEMPTGDALQKIINENDCLKGRRVPQLRTWLHGQKKKMIDDDDT